MMIRFEKKIDIPQHILNSIETLLQSVIDKDLEVIIKPLSKKRSLQANAYWHKLIELLADKLKTSKPYMKTLLHQKYGQLAYDGERVVTLIIRDDICLMEREELRVRPTTKTRVLENGKLYRVCLLLRGSHTFNTKEMSDLISGTIDDCKAVDIETLAPQELESMMAEYERRKSWLKK